MTDQWRGRSYGGAELEFKAEESAPVWTAVHRGGRSLLLSSTVA